MSDAELFTRLLYFGTVHLNRSEEETWLTSIGLLLDLIECHMQFIGRSKRKVELTIDQIIPEGI
ncbi:hypothetical protein LJC74_05870 [Eubacteriales bacterium OttesenSCG-928-A19]|nr:hypothetical protein [Eubacteriales bacterium OttesenSCG-928-A19]